MESPRNTEEYNEEKPLSQSSDSLSVGQCLIDELTVSDSQESEQTTPTTMPETDKPETDHSESLSEGSQEADTLLPPDSSGQHSEQLTADFVISMEDRSLTDEFSSALAERELAPDLDKVSNGERDVEDGGEEPGLPGGEEPGLPDLEITQLPQSRLLSGLHGKDKASVMRRSVVMRKKPTRQGLRDSLFKSQDESAFPSLTSDGSKQQSSHDTESTEQNGRITPQPKPASRASSLRHMGVALPGISPLAMPQAAPRDEKHINLSNDLANMLKKRQTTTAVSKSNLHEDEESVMSSKLPSLSSTSAENYRDGENNMTGNNEAQRIRGAIDEEKTQTSTGQMKSAMPDVVPRLSPRRLPDLPLSTTKEEKPEGMQISPDQKAPAVYRKPELKPIPNIKPARASNIENNTDNTSSSVSTETINAPWKPKLRKVERPAVAAKPEQPPAAAPKPRLKPVIERASYKPAPDTSSEPQTNKLSPRHLESIDKSSLDQKVMIAPHQESMSVSSLPTKSMVPPESGTRPTRLKPMEGTSPRLPNEGDKEESKPAVALRTKPTPMRKPTVENKPDWIKQAAEKRKRASLLIEQDEQLKSSPSSDNKSSDSEPAVQLRHPTNRTRRSSSIDSNSSDAAPQVANVPAWKRELNKQNSKRVMDRYSKVESNSDSKVDSQTDKENSGSDSPVPVWKKELRRLSSRSSIISEEISEGLGSSGGAEPEFIKLFKKRQERLKKTGSEIRESDC